MPALVSAISTFDYNHLYIVVAFIDLFMDGFCSGGRELHICETLR